MPAVHAWSCEIRNSSWATTRDLGRERLRERGFVGWEKGGSPFSAWLRNSKSLLLLRSSCCCAITRWRANPLSLELGLAWAPIRGKCWPPREIKGGPPVEVGHSSLQPSRAATPQFLESVVTPDYSLKLRCCGAALGMASKETATGTVETATVETATAETAAGGRRRRLLVAVVDGCLSPSSTASGCRKKWFIPTDLAKNDEIFLLRSIWRPDRAK